MNLRDILTIIIKRMKIIVIFPVVLVTIVSYMNYTRQPPVYSTSAVLYTIDKGTTNLTEIAAVERLMPNYQLLSTTSEMRAIVTEALGYGFGDCSVSVSMNTEAHTMTISTRSKNPARAANVANTYASCIIKYLKDTMGREDITILESASKPSSPSGPERKQSILTAGGGGLLLGIIFVLLLEMSNNTIRHSEDIEKEYGLPTLAEIGKFNKGKKK